MSEPTNALRVWMRFALALALVFGTVAGSVAPALGQEDSAAAEAGDGSSVEETQPAADRTRTGDHEDSLDAGRGYGSRCL